MATKDDIPSPLPISGALTQPADLTKVIDTSRLRDQSVVITGGASGLGQAIVKAMAEAGYASVLLIQRQVTERKLLKRLHAAHT
jgi:NADPH:quinone reductase-like Zn-dependent oxidoreductase